MKIKLAAVLVALAAALAIAAIKFWPVIFPPTWGSPWSLGPDNKMVIVFDDLSRADDDSIKVRIAYTHGSAEEVYVNYSTDCAPFRTDGCQVLREGGEIVVTKEKGKNNMSIFLPSEEKTAEGRWELVK